MQRFQILSTVSLIRLITAFLVGLQIINLGDPKQHLAIPKAESKNFLNYEDFKLSSFSNIRHEENSNSIFNFSRSIQAPTSVNTGSIFGEERFLIERNTGYKGLAYRIRAQTCPETTNKNINLVDIERTPTIQKRMNSLLLTYKEKYENLNLNFSILLKDGFNTDLNCDGKIETILLYQIQSDLQIFYNGGIDVFTLPNWDHVAYIELPNLIEGSLDYIDLTNDNQAEIIVKGIEDCMHGGKYQCTFLSAISVKTFEVIGSWSNYFSPPIEIADNNHNGIPEVTIPSLLCCSIYDASGNPISINGESWLPYGEAFLGKPTIYEWNSEQRKFVEVPLSREFLINAALHSLKDIDQRVETNRQPLAYALLKENFGADIVDEALECFKKKLDQCYTPVLPPIRPNALWIENMYVEYTGVYPNRAIITITNRSSDTQKGILVLRWTGKGMNGIIETKEVSIEGGNSSIYEVKLATIYEKATSLIAEIGESKYEVFLQSPPLPPSDDYSFELIPSVENASELRVTTPEGYIYTFPIRKVRIVLDKSHVPKDYIWEKVQTYVYIRVPLSECLIQSFMPWWIKVFKDNPVDVMGTELVLSQIEKATREYSGTQIPLRLLMDIKTAIMCTEQGILYPLQTLENTEAYFVVGKAVHLLAYYMNGTYSTTYVWEGEGGWRGYITENTSEIRLTIFPKQSNNNFVEDLLCKMLGLCKKLECKQTTNNGLCYWEGFNILNNQMALTNYPECALYGQQEISVGLSEGAPNISYMWSSPFPSCNSLVKGYPAIIAGWHFGDRIAEFPDGYLTPAGMFGLPTQIGKGVSFNSGFLVSREGGRGIANLSWKIWITSEPNPQKPLAEIMIWPWYLGQTPISENGSPIKSVRIGRWEWDLYRGKSQYGHWVFTFKRKVSWLESILDLWKSQINFEVDLDNFIKYLVQEGYLSNDHWVAGIEFGSEIVEGKGKWVFSDYWLKPTTSSDKS